jgi:hypothetical protein
MWDFMWEYIDTVMSNLFVWTPKCRPEIGILKRCRVDLIRARRITSASCERGRADVLENSIERKHKHYMEAKLRSKSYVRCPKLRRFRCCTKLYFMTVILYALCCVHVYPMHRQCTVSSSDFERDISTETFS